MPTEGNDNNGGAVRDKEGGIEGVDGKSDINAEEGAATDAVEKQEILMQEAPEPIGSKILLAPYRNIIAER